jgi:hypothetical protein
MSEIKKRRHYINIASFKLNRISLLNQSNLNNSFEKLNIPKSKLVTNNTSMPFNIFFIPVRNINSNSKNRENNNKINPLTEKNKIIRKHNMLQKIDFNIYLVRNNNKKENKKNPISLNNNINDNFHDRINLHINRITSNFQNNYKKITNNSKNNNDFNFNKTLNLNLPFITHIKENINKNNSKSNLYNNINLTKNIDTSFLFNNLKNGNIISPSHKMINNLKKYSKIFTNDKIKKSYSLNPKKLKVNYTEHSMIKEFNNLILNEDNKKDEKTKNDMNTNLNNKNEELKIKDENNKNNDENDKNNNCSIDSKDDICDINEIEKIISKSSYNMYPHNCNNENNINNNTNYLFNKTGNESQNKKHVLLNSLYRMQKINDNQFFEHNKTSFNNYMNMKNKNSNKSNKVSQGTNTETRMDYLTNDITLNIFNQTYFGNEDNLYLKEKNKIKNKKDLMPYNFKKKIIKNNRTFNFNTSVNHSNSKNIIKKIIY